MSAEITAEPSCQGAEGWSDLVSQGRGALIAMLLLGCWVIAADAMVIATILPSIGASLDAYAWFGGAGSLFLMGLVVAAASSGWLAARIGLRLALMLGGVGFAAGCLLSAMSPGIAIFLAGRALQGCAAGWLSGLIYIAVATLFPIRHLPRIFALITSIWAVATFVGPLLGGLFADAGHWRGVFVLFVAQGLLFAIVSLVLVPPGRASNENGVLPMRSLTLLAVSIGAFSSASVAHGFYGATVLVFAGVIVLVAAIRVDRATRHGVLPRHAADPGFPLGAAYLTYFCSTAASASFALYAPALIQHRFGLSALEAGYIVAIEALAWTAAALVVSGAGETWRARLIVLGPSVILVGTIINAFSINTGSIPAIAGGGSFLGAGFGLCYAFISRRVIAAFDDSNRVRGSSAISAARNSGGAIGAATAAIAANAAGFSDGLTGNNIHLVAWAVFGSAIPFALAALFLSVRVAYAPAKARPF